MALLTRTLGSRLASLVKLSGSCYLHHFSSNGRLDGGDVPRALQRQRELWFYPAATLQEASSVPGSAFHCTQPSDLRRGGALQGFTM